MKTFSIVLSLALMLSACGEAPKEDKSAKLAALKKQHAELTAQIRTLEAELAADGGKSGDGKVNHVSVTELKAGSFLHYLEIYGKLDAEDNVMTMAKMPGTVSRILVVEGQQVSAGQVVAELESDAIVAGIEELKTGLKFAAEVYEKQKALWDKKIGTELQYLNAKNQKEQLEKKLVSLNEQLDMMRIKSPINGTVDMIALKVGQSTAPGTPGIRIVNMSNIKAVASVSETYAGSIRKDNEVVVAFPDLKKEVKSRLSFAGKVIDPINRTFEVEVSLNPSDDLHANMLAVLKIVDYKNDSSLTVPVNVLVNTENGTYIMVADEAGGKKQAKKRYVQTGLVSGDRCEIRSGLEPGDKVITTGYQDLNDGDILAY